MGGGQDGDGDVAPARAALGPSISHLHPTAGATRPSPQPHCLRGGHRCGVSPPPLIALAWDPHHTPGCLRTATSVPALQWEPVSGAQGGGGGQQDPNPRSARALALYF